MEQQGQVVQTVVTTDFEEEDEPSLGDVVCGLIKGIITLANFGMMVYILVHGVLKREKKKDISVAPKPNENV